MAENRVTCIRPASPPATEHITHLGGPPTWGPWTVDVVITKIESGTDKFYTEAGGRRAHVFVAKTKSGKKYVRTEPDDTKKDNLLSLPNCS